MLKIFGGLSNFGSFQVAAKPAPKADEEEFDLFGSDEEPAAKPQKPKKAEKKAKEQPQVHIRVVA